MQAPCSSVCRSVHACVAACQVAHVSQLPLPLPTYAACCFHLCRYPQPDFLISIDQVSSDQKLELKEDELEGNFNVHKIMNTGGQQ
jgi:hypothetical protein